MARSNRRVKLARSWIRLHGRVVVKADGLCAGKGVLVTSSASEAKEFIERLMNGD